MTARLPVVGGDDGDWGTILNGFLEVAHNANGTLSPAAVSAAGAEITTNKGVASGYAPLNSSSLVPTTNLGTGSASSSNYLRGDGTWATTPSASVSSVFTRTGAITAQSGDYNYSQVGAAQGLVPTAVKTSAYSANPGDFIPVDTSGGSVIITLPTTPADKTRIAVKMINAASSNIVTINTGGSDVFDIASGYTNLTLALLDQSVELQYLSSSGIWYQMSDNLALSQLDVRYLPSGPNLLTANQAEVINGNTTGFGAVNCTLSATTTETLVGTYSLELTSSAAGTMRVDIPAGTPLFAVSSGTVYTALVSIRAATVSRVCHIGLNWYNSSNVFLSSTTGTNVSDTTTGWTNLSVTGAPIAGAAYVQIVASVTGTAAAGEIHYMDCFSFAASTSTTWAPSGQTPSTNLFTSVKSVGATGNGVTDDTAAIQNAINQGGVTFFPAGTYLISETISMTAGAHLLGVGYWGSGYTPPGSTSEITLANGSNCHMFEVTISASAPGNISVMMENLYMNGNGANQTSGDIVHLDDASGYTITSQYFRQTNCSSFDPYGHAIYIGQYNEDWRLDNCVYYGGNGYGSQLVYIATHATDGIMNNCDVGNGYIDNVYMDASLSRIIGGQVWGSQTGCGVILNSSTGSKGMVLVGVGIDTHDQAGVRIEGNAESIIIDASYVHDNSTAGDALYSNIEHQGTGHVTVTSVGFITNGESTPLPSYGINVTGSGSLIESNNYVTAGATRNGYISPGSYANIILNQADPGLGRSLLHVPALGSAQAVATGNISLSGTQTIDGYSAVASDVILATGQTTTSQNGPWVVASGAWSRPTDFATGLSTKGRTIQVVGGTVNAGTIWLLSNTSSVTVDTSSQTWQVASYGTLDEMASAHPAVAAVTVNSQKITNLANGVAATDAAAFGQVPLHTDWRPADQNLITWAYDGAYVSGTGTIASGTLSVVRLHVAAACTIHNILLSVTSAGSGLTSGQSLAGLYSLAGALLSGSADQSTAFASTGLITIALTTPQSVSAGDFYVCFYSTGTTPPGIGISGNHSYAANAGLVANSGNRFALGNTGLTTSLPSTFTMGGQAPAYWVALS